jgi:hypothetical protein
VPEENKSGVSNKDVIEVIFEIIILILFIKPIFGFGIPTGIGYVLAIIGSVYNGLLFKKKDFPRYLIGGTILCYAAGTLLPSLIQNAQSKNWISFIIMALLAVYIWLKGYFLKEGKEI